MTVANARVHDRVLVNVESRRARWIGALAVAIAFGWLIALVVGDHRPLDWHPGGRLAWSLALLVAVMLVARGLFLGRPVTVTHGAAAAVMLVTGLSAHLLGLAVPGDGLVAGAGVALMWPMASRRDPAALPRVWALIEATRGDPLAPFAMQSMKSYYFNAQGNAAIAYRARLGFAVVSGDPIGQHTQFRELVGDFAAMCRSRGWRIMVLGCGERQLSLWRDAAVLGQSLLAVPIGRDVVVDVQRFRRCSARTTPGSPPRWWPNGNSTRRWRPNWRRCCMPHTMAHVWSAGFR